MDTNELFVSNVNQNRPQHDQLNTNFTDRQKSLFDQLAQAETSNKTRIQNIESISMDTDHVPTRKRKHTSETKQFRGQESIFKKPDEPIGKCLPFRYIPDYKRNPHKWTKYTLDDVNMNDLTDRANTNAALSFLKELELRKEEITVETNVTDFKPQFNKTVMIKKKVIEQNEKELEKPIFKGSKIVMPEYEVGQKKAIKNKNPVHNVNSEKGTKIKEVKLDHLSEYEDE